MAKCKALTGSAVKGLTVTASLCRRVTDVAVTTDSSSVHVCQMVVNCYGAVGDVETWTCYGAVILVMYYAVLVTPSSHRRHGQD